MVKWLEEALIDDCTDAKHIKYRDAGRHAPDNIFVYHTLYIACRINQYFNLTNVLVSSLFPNHAPNPVSDPVRAGGFGGGVCLPNYIYTQKIILLYNYYYYKYYNHTERTSLFVNLV